MSGRALIIFLILLTLGMGVYNYLATGNPFCGSLPGEGPCWYGGYPR